MLSRIKNYLRSPEFAIDKGFDLVFFIASGGITQSSLFWIADVPLHASLTIGGFVAALVVGIVEFVRYEIRRRQHLTTDQVKAVIVRQMTAIRTAGGQAKIAELIRTGVMLTAALGDKVGHDYMDHLGDEKIANPEQSAILALSYLDGLLCRSDLKFDNTPVTREIVAAE